ncbi:hypothetical protein D3C80_1924290 [compost metagenome]
MFYKDHCFGTELREDEGDTPGGKVKVQFHRRPTEAFQQQAPLAYNKLTCKPQFLFIRARKPQL